MTDDEPQLDDDRAGSSVGPVVTIARSEVRTRWLSLVLIGLLAGVVGAVAISGVALARRTTTAYDRLGEETEVDDARGGVLRYPELVDELTELPVVTDSWVGGFGIAKIEGDNTFIGITAGPRVPSPIFDPIVLDGRPVLRTTMMNPLTTIDDLQGLLECLRRFGRQLIDASG